jgi:Zn-dependent protease
VGGYDCGMFIRHLQEDPKYFFAVVITVVISICLHELAHGIVAIWRGDRTPIDTGHMTLSPFVHMGPFSLIALLMAGVSWGSMPVDPTRLRGKYAEAMVAAAGPFCNILLSLAALVALGLWKRFDSRTMQELTPVLANAQYLLAIFGLYNMLLAMFNLLPIPPLDGSRIAGNFSRKFDETVNALPLNAPGLYLPLTLVAFIAAGTVLFPLAERVSLALLSGIRGG